MANRFPLVVDATNKNIEELPSGDNLDLSGSSIINSNLVENSSLSTTNTADSVVQRTANGRVKTSNATESNDAVALGQTGTAFDKDVQTSAADATAGRVLTVGAFGLGDISTPTILDADLAVNSGFYTLPSEASNLPPVTSNYSLIVFSRSDNRLTQIAGMHGASNDIYTRHRFSGGWSPWVIMYHGGNLPDPARLGQAQTFTGIKTFNATAIDNGTLFSRTTAAGSVVRFGNTLGALGGVGFDADGSLIVRNSAIGGGVNTIFSVQENGNARVYGDLQVDGTINSSGNVGIGTSSPVSGLHYRAGQQKPLVIDRDGEVTFGGFGFNGIVFRARYDSTNYGEGALISPTSAAAWTSTSTPADIRFSTTPSGSTTTAERMRITSAGNVGIGTSSPGQKLVIADAGTLELNVQRTSAGGATTFIRSGGFLSTIGSATDHPLSLHVNNTERMRIDSSGLVGIGTSSPGARLDVAGSIRGQSAFYSDALAVSCATGVATTIVDLSLAKYRNRTIRVNVFDGGTHMGAGADVYVNWNGGANIYGLTQWYTGTNTSLLSISGSNLQFTHSFGSTRNVAVRLLIV